MMRRCVVVVVLILLASSVWSQQCPQALVLAPSHELNFFTEEQEVEFGNIVAEQDLGSLRVIEDSAVSGRLQTIVERLLKEMPATKLQFRAYVIDAPYNNAFTMPGGRMFFTRKMVAFAHSEDELAGVVAHEMGHQITHQIAQRWSRIFRDVLQVNKLGDGADIEDKYHKLLDIARTKKGIFRDIDLEREQAGADQVAVYALARAGYDPQAVVNFWDRFADTKGRKGSWFSDAFGTTWPESKRLRQFAKSVGNLPTSCLEAIAKRSADDFQAWQILVKNYNGFGKKEDLHNVVQRIQLQPPLRGDIQHIRFSPDGKYVLAQDDASIFVLTREPLAPLFRIDAIDAYPAMFSPDSQSVVFYMPGLRVERWSIAEKRALDVNEVHEFRGCVQTALSPDGATLACVTPNRDTFFPLELALIDVASGEPVVSKKNFVGPALAGLTAYISYLRLLAGQPVMAMAFSPDGRFFLAGRPEVHFMYDMRARTEMDMRGELKKFTSLGFAFIGPDRIVAKNDDRGEHGAVLHVPSGEILQGDIPIGPVDIHTITKGDYAVLGPLSQAPIGIMDLKTKKLFMASKMEAIDFYDGSFVQERVNGELGLYGQAGKPPIARAALPLAPVAAVHAAAISPDLHMFAVSDRTRGAVWDLRSGERLAHVRGFRGALFGEGALFTEFAPVDQYSSNTKLKGETEKDVRKREADRPGRIVARMDLATGDISELVGFTRRQQIYRAGSVLLVLTPDDDDEPNKNVTIEGRDLRTGDLLWSRRLARWSGVIHGNNGEDSAVLLWYLGTSSAKEELRDDPDAKKLVDAIKNTEGSYLLEVLDSRTGRARIKFPVETGRASFGVRGAYAGSGVVVVTDTFNRVLLYSYEGKRLGGTFGRNPALSTDGGLLCVEREPGRLAVLDTKSLQKRDQFTFGERVVFADFSDPKHLVVLTADQTLFVLEVGALPTKTAVLTP